MIPKETRKLKSVESFTANGSFWERAPHSGVFIIKKGLGNVVEANDLLGIVCDPLGNDEIEVRSKGKGIIIGQNQLPLVNRGDALFHIATFDKTNPVGKSMQQFDDKFDYEER